MKPRWSLDLLRGVLLAVAARNFFEAPGILRLGIAPYRANQFWGGAGILIVFALVCWALLYPSRIRLQGVFVVFTVAAILPPLQTFWYLRAYPQVFEGRPFPVESFCFGIVSSVALAVAAGFLYRSEPVKT